MKPKKIEIMPSGVSISFNITLEDYNKKIKYGNTLALKKIIVAAAGPLTNLMLIYVFLYTKNNIAVYSNILIALFNLIPIYPLDGGRILKGIIHINAGRQKSKKIIYIVSNITIIIITVLGSILILLYNNIAIFIIIITLWGILMKENRKYNFLENTIK